MEDTILDTILCEMEGTIVETFEGEMGLIDPAAGPIIEDILAQRGVVSISDFTPSDASAFLEFLVDSCLDIDEDVLRERFTFFRERYGCVMRDDVRTEAADLGEAEELMPHAAPSQQDAGCRVLMRVLKNYKNKRPIDDAIETQCE